MAIDVIGRLACIGTPVISQLPIFVDWDICKFEQETALLVLWRWLVVVQFGQPAGG